MNIGLSVPAPEVTPSFPRATSQTEADNRAWPDVILSIAAAAAAQRHGGLRDRGKSSKRPDMAHANHAQYRHEDSSVLWTYR